MTIDPQRLNSVHEAGGIRTGLLDGFGVGSAATGGGCRVALFDTGAGFRFTVAIDRGGDVVDASFNQHNLAYLSHVGYRPPSHAFNRSMEWIANWPGGLMTSCGPQFIGGARQEDGYEVTTHGHHSNTPAVVTAVTNPDPRAGRLGMKLGMVIEDVRVSARHLRVEREVSATLGKPELVIEDVITNLHTKASPHHWLYHVNFGWPLLDKGAKIVMAGRHHSSWGLPDSPGNRPTSEYMQALKTVEVEMPGLSVGGGRGLILDADTDAMGNAHCGLVNEKIGVGVEVEWATASMPRLGNWQAYGGDGSYVMSLEPFTGSLKGKANDDHAQATQYLQPGESRRYRMAIRVHSGASGVAKLMAMDRAIPPRAD